jgi:hypothetical protein
MVRFANMVDLRRHLLSRHQHDVICDEVRQVPAEFLAWAFRDVGLLNTPTSRSHLMSASQVRRRQRERSAARMAEVARESEGPPQSMRRIRAEASSVASATSGATADDGWNHRPLLELPELTEELGDSRCVDIASVAVVLREEGSQTEWVNRADIGVQTSEMRFCLPVDVSDRDLARLAAEHPTEGGAAILRRYEATHRRLSDDERIVTSIFLRGCIVGMAVFASQLRRQCAAPLQEDETPLIRMKGLWHGLDEYIDRDH